MTDSHKLAALRLSGLNEQDRDWILSRLPVTDQEKILGLLNEADKFGIDNPDEYVEKIISTKGKSSTTKSNNKLLTQEESPRCKIINMANGSDVMKILDAVPCEIIAAMLSEREWKWEQDYLLSRGYEKMQQLQAMKIQKSKLGDRAKAVLIECIAAELDPNLGQSANFDQMLMAEKKPTKKGIFNRRGSK